MNPKIKALKFIGYALDAIEELRQLNPNGVIVFKTHSGKLAHPGIKGGDFESVLKKIESKGVALFNEGLGNSAEGWGSNPLEIRVQSWDKFDEYYEEIKSGYGQDLNSKTVGEAVKSNPVISSGWLERLLGLIKKHLVEIIIGTIITVVGGIILSWIL